jgi:hypothetical protein
MMLILAGTLLISASARIAEPARPTTISWPIAGTTYKAELTLTTSQQPGAEGKPGTLRVTAVGGVKGTPGTDSSAATIAAVIDFSAEGTAYNRLEIAPNEWLLVDARLAAPRRVQAATDESGRLKLTLKNLQGLELVELFVAPDLLAALGRTRVERLAIEWIEGDTAAGCDNPSLADCLTGAALTCGNAASWSYRCVSGEMGCKFSCGVDK